MTNGKPRRTKFPANLVGPQIRRLRAARGWSQTKLALRLQLSGLNIGREVLAQIEAQTHCLKDKDIPYFAHALKVDLADLYFGNQNGQRSPAAVIALLQTACQPKPCSNSCNEFITTPLRQNW
jgi:transcriptional regulator with XRE-family HTH domain